MSDALNTQSESEDAIGGGNTGDAPASDPLHTHNTLFTQCAHTQTCQEEGVTVCMACGVCIAKGQAAEGASPASDDEELGEWTA